MSTTQDIKVSKSEETKQVLASFTENYHKGLKREREELKRSKNEKDIAIKIEPACMKSYVNNFLPPTKKWNKMDVFFFSFSLGSNIQF